MTHVKTTLACPTRRQTLGRWLTTLTVGSALALAAATATAAGWPSGPVRIVVPYPAGGLTDVVTRVVAEGLGQQIGQPVIVENKPGAGGQIGLQGVLQAPRDGQTIALVVPATMITLPLTNPAGALVKAIRSPAVSQRLTSMGFVVAGNERAAFKDAILRSTAVYKDLVASGATQ